MYAVRVMVDGEWKTGACRHASITEANRLRDSFTAQGLQAETICVDGIGSTETA